MKVLIFTIFFVLLRLCIEIKRKLSPKYKIDDLNIRLVDN